MSLAILNKEIRRIHVIDDDPEVRGAYLEHVKDMDVEGIDVSNSIVNIESLFSTIDTEHDGIICDYQLTGRKYSACNGDVFGKAAYDRHIPFILSSHFKPLSLGGQRRYIPKAVAADDFGIDAVREAFELCLGEYQGSFSLRRRPIRTLVRIEGMKPYGAVYQLNVVVPNWNPTDGVQILIDASSLPDLSKLQAEIEATGEARLTAEVNTGATDSNELYFSEWKSL